MCEVGEGGRLFESENVLEDMTHAIGFYQGRPFCSARQPARS